MDLGDIWDWFSEQFSNSWELTTEMFSGLFSNLGEFSIPGTIGGLVCVIFIYLIRGYTLTPFIKYIPNIFSRIFTEFGTYAVCFAFGYIFIKHAFEQ